MDIAADVAEIEQGLLSEVSVDDGWHLIERFSSLVRESGMPDEHAAADYIAAELDRLRPITSRRSWIGSAWSTRCTSPTSICRYRAMVEWSSAETNTEPSRRRLRHRPDPRGLQGRGSIWKRRRCGISERSSTTGTKAPANRFAAK